MTNEANQIMDSVSGIVSLNKLNIGNFEESVHHAKKKSRKTVEQLHELDASQTKALKGPKAKFDVMQNYLAQIRGAIRNPAWQIPNFHFGEAARMPAYSVMYKHVHKDALARLKKEREKEDQTNPFMDGLKTVGSSVKGVGTGAGSAIKDTGVGLWNTFRHPVETGESLYTAVRHPIVTSKAIGKSVKESYDENMAKGNAESRADWVTYAALNTVGEVFGSKGAGAVSKASKIGKAAEASAGVGKKAPEVRVRDGGKSEGVGNIKHLDDVPRIKEVEVNFKRNVKHDSEEFARQLKDQEKGMNELTVDEYLKNRDRYIAEGRAIEGNAAQKWPDRKRIKIKLLNCGNKDFLEWMQQNKLQNG